MMVDRIVRADLDPVVSRDPRVMDQLLASQDRTAAMVDRCCFQTVQRDIKPYMRRIVAKWMLEVCEEQGAEDVVFPLAMSYVDRFLSSVSVQKCHLQLLGAVCLLVASKLRQSRTLSVDTLIYYTDYSVSADDMMTWELMVLSRLKWDVASVVPCDFVDPIISRLDVDDGHHVVRRHANTFIALCATEYKFTSYPPSLLAAASVATAVHRLPWLDKPWSTLQGLLDDLQKITTVHSDCIRLCMTDIEELVSLSVAQLQQAISSTRSTQHVASMSAACQRTNCTVANCGSQPETPTDVQDVLM